MKRWAAVMVSGMLGGALAGWLAAGCGDDETSAAAPPGTTTSGSGGEAAAGAAGGGPGGQGGMTLDAGGDAPSNLGCSADLRSVIDAEGNVVLTCLPEEGCLDGTCIEACAAAAGSHGHVGCDFRVTTPGTYPPTLPPCFAVFLTNTWPKAAQITVSRGGDSFDVTAFGRIPQNGVPEDQWPAVPAGGLPVGEVAVLFLSHDPNCIFQETGLPVTCPVTPAVDASTVLAGTGVGLGFHIQTDTPVSAYDILPYGGAESHFPSAQLLFPTSAWGDNYVLIATPPGTHSVPGPLWGHVLATEDDTSLEILPSVDLPAGTTFPAAPAGVTTGFELSAGEYLQWELPAGSADMSGSVLLSDKPVAVFTGNRFFRFQPTPAPGGESTHQQLLAVSTLAHDYVAAPYETRRADLAPEEIHYRLVGAAEGTTLSWDPAVPGAPSVIGQGTVADFTATGPFRVLSQNADHPFALAQMMDTANIPGGTRPGATAPGYPPMLGDEEFVVVLPPAQFLSYYVFFTDPAYPTTNLVLTRVKRESAFHDVEVDCLGTVGGWQSVGGEGLYEVTSVDLIRAEVGVGTCDNGRHTATSDGPFGLVVWGLDSYSSYAYPAGGNAAQLTDVVVTPVPK